MLRRAVKNLKDAQGTGQNARIDKVITEINNLHDDVKKEWTEMKLARTSTLDSGNED